MKELVKRNFSISARTYERHAFFQKTIGEKLLKRITLFNPPLPVLDVGCGTGSLLKNLKFFGLDISLEMAKSCSRFGTCICADAENIPFRDESFPTVFSNFSLQWTNLNFSFREISRVLKEGGFFFLSIPVAGSLNTLFSCWKRVSNRLPLFKFPKEKSVFQLFKNFFEVIEFERVYLEKEFENPRKALKSITGVGAKNPHGTASFREAKKFKELFSENPKIEFKVLIITGKKK
jgi:malonyl-CoA O-methyltransferase